MRIRSKWQSGKATLEDNASALAYIIWQISLEQTKNLHREDYIYDDDHQRTGVLAEYLCFLVHLSDRLTIGSLSFQQRGEFMQTLAKGTARHLQRNLEDVYGRNQDYRIDYVNQLNERIAEYSGYGFSEQEPGYSMLRSLGRHIQDLMGEGQTNRWIIDQVMEIDSKTAIAELKKGLDNLFGSATSLGLSRAPEI